MFLPSRILSVIVLLACLSGQSVAANDRKCLSNLKALAVGTLISVNAAFGVIGCGGSGGCPATPQNEFALFLSEHGGAASPFTSSDRTGWRPVPSQMEAMNKGETAILGNSKVNLQFLDEWNKESAKSAQRDAAILKHISELVENRRKDELLIIFAGGLHIQEYFLENPTAPVIYIRYPYSDHATLFSDALAEYYELTNKPLDRDVGNPDMLAIPSLALWVKYGQPPLAKVYTTKDTSGSNVLMIADLHGFNSDSLKKLPGPDFWNAQGVRKIKVGMEGFEFGRTYSPQDGVKKASLDVSEKVEMYTKLLDLAENHPEELRKRQIEEKIDGAMVQQLVGSAKRLLEIAPNGRIPVYPQAIAFFEKLNELDQAMEISITGLELPGYRSKTSFSSPP